MLKNYYLVNLLLAITIICSANKDCIQRKYDSTSFVCVCNSTYCDSIESLPENLDKKEYVMYESTKNEHRMKQSIRNFKDEQTEKNMILINHSKKYQTIMGFGGGMTDSAGINIASLPKEAQDLLMQQYFGDTGIQYTIIRVPVGGTDFSTRPYTLDDTPYDTELKDFKLADEDYNYKIPYLKQAIELSNYPIYLMGASWTAPPYMKDNNDYVGGSRLLDQYFSNYAEYLVKFLQAYKDEGLDFYIISSGNEPWLSFSYLPEFNGMSFTPYSLSDFIANYLGPSIEQNGFENVKILIGDDQSSIMYRYLKKYLKNVNASRYASGVGIHWYLDNKISLKVLTDIHNLPGFENKFILYTEACYILKGPLKLGVWSYGTGYLSSIIDGLNNWSEGWVDWNLALDLDGGPSWAKNYVDSPIIVNASAGEFYKNPMYYAIAHVSKFIAPGSVRIDITNEHHFVKAAAFEVPNNQTVIVLLNTHDNGTHVSINDVDLVGVATFEMEPKSMVTIVYNTK